MNNIEHQTDAVLLGQFSESGSNAAFSVLVKRHGPMVHAVAMRTLSNHHDAQDVVQATFIALAREARKLGREPSVAGWLHTVSRRLALNTLKSSKSRQLRHESTMKDSITQTAAAASSADFRRELDAAFGRLSDRYRQPLLLVHIEGVSLEEAGRRLDLQPTALRTRLSRGREMLRQLLSRRGVEVASVTALSALLSAEAEASLFTPALESAVIKASLDGGRNLAPHILELAADAVGPATSLATLLKTKATLAAVIVLATLAITTTVVHVSRRDAPPQSTAAVTRSVSKSRAAASPENPAVRPVKIDLSGRSSENLEILIHRVLLINDLDERLRAIRESLGMTLSDEAYRKALASYGFQNNPSNLFGHLLKEWATEDPRAVALWAKQLPHGKVMGTRPLNLAMKEWLRLDEAAAMAWGRENTDPRWLATAQANAPAFPAMSAAETSTRMGETLERWNAITGTDPESIQAKQKLRNELEQLVLRMADTDPRAAVEFARAQSISSGDPYFGGHMASLVQRWAQHDPDAALEWAKALDGATIREYALESILPSWQIKHLDQPISKAVDLDSVSDKFYNDLMVRLALGLAIQSPQAAAEYLMEIKDSAMMGKAVDSVVPVVWLKSPDEARQWVTGLPSGELRDRSVGKLAQILSPTEFPSARQLLGEIQNPEIKQESIAQILRFTNALAQDLPAALELANALPQYSSRTLQDWARWVPQQEAPAYRAWLEKTYTEGRILNENTEQKAADTDFRALIDSLRYDSWSK